VSTDLNRFYNSEDSDSILEIMKQIAFIVIKILNMLIIFDELYMFKHNDFDTHLYNILLYKSTLHGLEFEVYQPFIIDFGLTSLALQSSTPGKFMIINANPDIAYKKNKLIYNSNNHYAYDALQLINTIMKYKRHNLGEYLYKKFRKTPRKSVKTILSEKLSSEYDRTLLQDLLSGILFYIVDNYHIEYYDTEYLYSHVLLYKNDSRLKLISSSQSFEPHPLKTYGDLKDLLLTYPRLLLKNLPKITRCISDSEDISPSSEREESASTTSTLISPLTTPSPEDIHKYQVAFHGAFGIPHPDIYKAIWGHQRRKHSRQRRQTRKKYINKKTFKSKSKSKSKLI
jgi:hypothetical protein